MITKKVILILSLFSILFTGNSFAERGLIVKLKANETNQSPVVDEVELYGSSYALVIGNDKYEQGWPALSNAVSDAKKVAKALEEKGFNISLEINLNSEDLKKTFEEFFILKGKNPQTRLFVWFAGHGHTLRNEGFLIPVDAPTPDNKANFRLKSLSMRRFGEFVRLAESKHTLAIFDSCFSGTIFESQRSLPPAAVTRATTLPVRQFISSGDANQTVSDNGKFRKLFIRAISGEERADANGDGYLTGSELGLFLTDRVTNLTRAQQTPRYGKLRDEDYDRGDFVFSVNSENMSDDIAKKRDVSDTIPAWFSYPPQYPGKKTVVASSANEEGAVIFALTKFLQTKRRLKQFQKELGINNSATDKFVYVKNITPGISIKNMFKKEYIVRTNTTEWIYVMKCQFKRNSENREVRLLVEESSDESEQIIETFEIVSEGAGYKHFTNELISAGFIIKTQKVVFGDSSRWYVMLTNTPLKRSIADVIHLPPEKQVDKTLPVKKELNLPDFLYKLPQKKGYLYAIGISDKLDSNKKAIEQARERARLMMSLSLSFNKNLPSKLTALRKFFYEETGDNEIKQSYDKVYTVALKLRQRSIISNSSVTFVRQEIIGDGIAVALAEISLQKEINFIKKEKKAGVLVNLFFETINSADKIISDSDLSIAISSRTAKNKKKFFSEITNGKMSGVLMEAEYKYDITKHTELTISSLFLTPSKIKKVPFKNLSELATAYYLIWVSNLIDLTFTHLDSEKLPVTYDEILTFFNSLPKDLNSKTRLGETKNNNFIKHFTETISSSDISRVSTFNSKENFLSDSAESDIHLVADSISIEKTVDDYQLSFELLPVKNEGDLSFKFVDSDD